MIFTKNKRKAKLDDEYITTTGRMVTEEIDSHLKNMYEKYFDKFTEDFNFITFGGNPDMTIESQMQDALKTFMEKWPSSTPVFILGKMTHDRLKKEAWEKFKDPRIPRSIINKFEDCKVIINELHPTMLEVVAGTPWEEPMVKDSPKDGESAAELFIDFNDKTGRHPLHCDFGIIDEFIDIPDTDPRWHHIHGMRLNPDALDALSYAINYPEKKESKSERIKRLLPKGLGVQS